MAEEQILKQIAQDIDFVKQRIIIIEQEVREITEELLEVRPEYLEKLKQIDKGKFLTREQFEKKLKMHEILGLL